MTEGDRIVFSYEDVLKEMNRRADIARTEATIRLTRWIVAATVAAGLGALVSAAAAVIALLK
jgi:hypothetical protein